MLYESREKEKSIDRLHTKFFASIVQEPGDVVEANSSSNCHGVGSLIDGNSVEVSKVNLDSVLNRA